MNPRAAEALSLSSQHSGQLKGRGRGEPRYPSRGRVS
jgi:hypothetical protein